MVVVVSLIEAGNLLLSVGPVLVRVAEVRVESFACEAMFQTEPCISRPFVTAFQDELPVVVFVRSSVIAECRHLLLMRYWRLAVAMAVKVSLSRLMSQTELRSVLHDRTAAKLRWRSV